MSPSASGHGPAASFAAPFVAPGPPGTAIRDRLRGLTAEDEQVLRSVGARLGALARRGRLAHVRSLEAGVRMLEHRLSLPIGEPGTKRAPGGYRSRGEWFVRSRRLEALKDRLAAERADWDAGRVRVVRGGRRLLNARHHLDETRLTENEWRQRWEAERWFLQADAPRRRYVLKARVAFPHRGTEWADRVEGNRAVSYRIHLDVERGRWYLTASWRRATVPTVPLEAARIEGLIGVDTNADHFVAWHLDRHGNPVGRPRCFDYDLSGSSAHRDAQVRHAITRLLHWAASCGVAAIGIEDLDFAAEKTRERHGRRKRFRQLISGMPTGRLKDRLVAMAAEAGLAIVAGISRHDAASIAVGRRALGHPIRRRTAPPRHHQSDDGGHRTVQADLGDRGREGSRHHVTERAPDARPRTRARRTRATSVSNTVRDACRTGTRVRIPLPDTVEER